MRFEPLERLVEYISMRHRSYQPDLIQLAAFVQEVLHHYGRRQHFILGTDAVTIVDGTAELPCDVHQVIRILQGGLCIQPPGYRIEGETIRFHNQHRTQAVVVSLKYSLDAQRRPMVPEIMIPACYWYYLMQTDVEPMRQGSSPERNFERAQVEFSKAIAAACSYGAVITDDEIDRAVQLVRTPLPARPTHD